MIKILYLSRMEEIMKEKKTYFGYEKEEILQNLRESNDQVDRNNKISEQETTLSQLANASGRLLEENKDFLYTIYNQLDN